MKRLLIIHLIFVIVFSLSAQEVPFKSIHQEQSEYFMAFRDLDEYGFDSLLGTKPYEASRLTRDCELKKTVFGYEPYWGGSRYLSYQWDLLSDLCYFSYEVDPNSGNPDDLHSFLTTPVVDTALAHGIRVHLCVTLFYGHSNFLGNPEAQQNLIDNLIDLLVTRNAAGVNIDFEAIPYNLGNQLTDFMVNLSLQLHDTLPESILSMAVPAVDWNGIFNIPVLNEVLDLFMIMGYDYYWNGSSIAGPVDGLYSMTAGYDYNLSRTLSWYIAQGASKEKIVLGLPYYGRQWATSSSLAPSTVSGWGNARTYYSIYGSSTGNYSDENKRMETNSCSPYFSFFTNGWNQCFINDKKSMGKRMDMANRYGIQGIGIWALGYDHGLTDLWDQIQYQLSDQDKPLYTDTIYDSGGPSFNYYNGEDYYYTIRTDETDSMALFFLEFNIEEGFDYLEIYDGPDQNSPLLGTFTGNDLPGPFHSSKNSLTLHFTSDNMTTGQGWTAVWQATTLSVPDVHTGSKPSWSVFPNPCMEQLIVEIDQTGTKNQDIDAKLFLYDLQGRILIDRSFSTATQQMKINLREAGIFRPGIYFIGMRMNKLSTGTKKLICLPQQVP